MPKAIVTSGSTIEKIDPVRYLSNFSSGRQGFAVAKELALKGFIVDYISANEPFEDIANINHIKIESAEEMLKAVLSCLPADVAVFVAAVCDWRPKDILPNKMKKQAKVEVMNLELVKNPDILQAISNHENRPKIVIGFAAESENLIENAKAKLQNKGCDYIIANDISDDVFGSKENEVVIISKEKQIKLPRSDKNDIAKKLVRVCVFEPKNDSLKELKNFLQPRIDQENNGKTSL